MNKAFALAGVLSRLPGRAEPAEAVETALSTETPPETPPAVEPEIELPDTDDILAGLPSFPIDRFEGTYAGWENAPEDAGASDDILDGIF